MIFLKDLPARYRRVADAIVAGNHRPIEIAAACGITYETAKSYIKEMVGEGWIGRQKRGHYVIIPDGIVLPYETQQPK